MTIQWSKQFKDGRSTPSNVSTEEIDFSSPIISATLSKVERDFKLNSKVLPLTNIIPYTQNIEYRAFDMKIQRVNDSIYLDLLYADRPDAPPPVGDGTMFEPREKDWFTGWHLFFTRVDLDTGNIVTGDVCITKNYGKVDESSKASINMFDDGRLVAVFQLEHGGTIVSCTSTDGGKNWGSFNSAVTKSSSIGTTSQSLKESQLTSVIKSHGNWRTLKDSKAKDDSILRNERKRSSDKGIISFVVLGTDIDLVTVASKTNCGKVKVFVDGVYQKTLNLNTRGGYKYKVRLNKKTLSYNNHTVRLEHYTGKYFYIDHVVALNKSMVFSHCDSIVRNRTGLTPNATDNQEIILLYEVTGSVSNSLTDMKFVADRSGRATDFGSNRVATFNFRTGVQKHGDRAVLFHENGRGLWIVMEVPDGTKYKTEYWLYSG